MKVNNSYYSINPPVKQVSTMNTVEKYIDSDGILHLDDVLGSYHRLGYESQLDRKRIEELNSRAEYLENYLASDETENELLNDSNRVELDTSSLLDVDEKTLSEVKVQFGLLVEYSDSELRRLSKALNENDFIIPDDFKVTVFPIEKEGVVFTQSSEVNFIVDIQFGHARLRESGTSEYLRDKIHDIVNGAIMLASSNLRFKE